MPKNCDTCNKRNSNVNASGTALADGVHCSQFETAPQVEECLMHSDLPNTGDGSVPIGPGQRLPQTQPAPMFN